MAEGVRNVRSVVVVVVEAFEERGRNLREGERKKIVGAN